MRGVILAAVAASLAGSASAQTCAPTDALTASLGQTYSEEPVWRGLSFQGYLLEIWHNAETGTWTVLAHRPDGVSCVMDAGRLAEMLATGEPV